MDALDPIRLQVLVLRTQVGDASAATELVRTFHHKLLRFVRGLLSNSSSADDIVQGVWTTVLRKLGSLRSPQSFEPWLFAVARNAAYRELRRLRRWEPLQDKVLDEVPTPVELPVDFESSSIRTSLECLAPEHREVLILRYFCDLNYAQIAATIGVAIGTVRSRIHYAHASLRKAMEDQKHDR